MFCSGMDRCSCSIRCAKHSLQPGHCWHALITFSINTEGNQSRDCILSFANWILQTNGSKTFHVIISFHMRRLLLWHHSRLSTMYDKSSTVVSTLARYTWNHTTSVNRSLSASQLSNAKHAHICPYDVCNAIYVWKKLIRTSRLPTVV